MNLFDATTSLRDRLSWDAIRASVSTRSPVWTATGL
jgi:hypothetical protein